VKPITFEVPMRAQSASNLREHPMGRARRVKLERTATAYVAKGALRSIAAVLVVKLTRRGKRQLDDDNLRGALKSFRDELARTLRVDDATRLIRWEYDQETGDDAVVVTIARAEVTP
jgi:hypothetical protein